MWNPPIALTPEEQKIAARTRKTRTFFVFLRERCHELLDATFQATLTATYSAEPGGKEPVEAGLLALATLLQAYYHVGDRDAVELTVMDKRWQLVLDCLGAELAPFSQGTLCHFRMRLMAHNLEQHLAGADDRLGRADRGLRCPAAAGGPGLHTAVWRRPCGEHIEPAGACVAQGGGLAARELGASAEAILEEAGLVLVGHNSLKAALDLDWGQPKAREQALRLVLEEVERWEKMAGAAPAPCGGCASHTGRHGHYRPDCHAGHRTSPGGWPWQKAHQEAGGLGAAHLH
jgi:hypothetical protein